MPLLQSTSQQRFGRRRARRRSSRWMRHRARRALDLLPRARQFVQRPAVALERRVHRRHLLDARR
ncbi:MAG: hypothetical protein MZW92_48215 [Comamonadaceae bacterium]|nr:hypothetical protein [Comamonadaceae bacterium]